MDRDPARVERWLKAVDATEQRRTRAPGSLDRDPCGTGGTRPCHIVRRKASGQTYACRAQAVVDEMLAFTANTRETEARIAAFPVFERWMKAVEAADVEAIVRLYAPDATLIAPGNKQLVGDPSGIRAYFEDTLRAVGPRTVGLMYQYNSALTDDIVVVRGAFESRGSKDGKAFSEPLHFTFIIAKRDAGWLIAHSHVSTVPP